MRHGKKFNHLGRKTAHRKAMLSNMASSLIKHKRVSTTLAKAKALRSFVEPIITKTKNDSTHSRRMAFSYLRDKESVAELFDTVAGKVAERPGGYTRIIKVANRYGDNANMCIIELVDFNENLLTETSSKPKTRRSRRGGKKSDASSEAKPEAKVQSKPEAKVQAKKEEAPKSEAPKAEDKPKAEPKSEAKVQAKKEEASKSEAPKTEEKPKAEAKPDADVQAKKSEDKKSDTKEDDKKESK